MRVSVREAARLLEERGMLRRDRKDYSERTIAHVGRLIGQKLPTDLEDFYRERIEKVGDFWAFAPTWNDHVGWRTPDEAVTELLHVQAMPICDDGCGNWYGLDLCAGDSVPAVYFFNHEREFEEPEHAAGSSLGTFLLLLGEKDQAFEEGRPDGWELAIDPDIDKCPRAPPIWLAG